MHRQRVRLSASSPESYETTVPRRNGSMMADQAVSLAVDSGQFVVQFAIRISGSLSVRTVVVAGRLGIADDETCFALTAIADDEI